MKKNLTNTTPSQDARELCVEAQPHTDAAPTRYEQSIGSPEPAAFLDLLQQGKEDKNALYERLQTGLTQQVAPPALRHKIDQLFDRYFSEKYKRRP